MTTIEAIRDDFAFLDEWEDRYRYVIDLGAALAPFPDESRIDAYKVRGCVSQVWLTTRVGDGPDPVVEFQAGERLRADYTRGQLMPRLGANWVASVSSGRRDGGIADLTDAALGARIRVEHAIRAVGPELSGILIDVCCFLKGMETVEMERGWPVRSAKIVLKTALGVLSRHYNPDSGHERRPRQTLHWGAGDYRPSIT